MYWGEIMWKKIRVFILLMILGYVSFQAWQDTHQNWDKPIVIVIHPINADGRATTAAYIQNLKIQQFYEIQDYLAQKAKSYQKKGDFMMVLGRTLDQGPPLITNDNNIVETMLWSLKFRYYAWKQKKSSDGYATVTLYLNYYDVKETKVLKHSTALERGKIGIANIFAHPNQESQNNVVITHELLHAFGAQDKYDFKTGQPIFPQGYANPKQSPLLPQYRAEIMAGYIPITEQKSVMPMNLQRTVIGDDTAQEVGWISSTGSKPF